MVRSMYADHIVFTTMYLSLISRAFGAGIGFNLSRFRIPFPVGFHNLSQDRQRDLLGSLRANIQADRRMQPGPLSVGQPISQQALSPF
jgi:hypothetical protein